MDEFELIARYLAPLAGEGAFGLKDDAALFSGQVLTKDVLVDGVHFRTEDGWCAAAQKAIRVNVSDLVAKGVHADGLLLGIVWPWDAKAEEIESFCEGLSTDIKKYNLNLLGGDTTRHRQAGAPLTVSVTMMGAPGPNGPLLRSSATPGDLVFVTGTIGDGWLGLEALLQGRTDYPQAVETYLQPSPPVALIDTIAANAAASLDISDGLVADAGHLAVASGVRLTLWAKDIPYSDEAKAWLTAGGEPASLLTGGDDYQPFMTVSAEQAESLKAAAQKAGVRLTHIGDVEEGEGVTILSEDGTPMRFEARGFSHF